MHGFVEFVGFAECDLVLGIAAAEEPEQRRVDEEVEQRRADEAAEDDRGDGIEDFFAGSPAARTSGISAMPAVSAVMSIGARRSLTGAFDHFERELSPSYLTKCR
jgi:hypothetical protein